MLTPRLLIMRNVSVTNRDTCTSQWTGQIHFLFDYDEAIHRTVHGQTQCTLARNYSLPYQHNIRYTRLNRRMRQSTLLTISLCIIGGSSSTVYLEHFRPKRVCT
jgi:hypothetical protein